MRKLSFNIVKITFLIFIITILSSAWAFSGDDIKLVATSPNNIAIKGYDTVAYFTEGKAVMGKPDITYAWQDAQWHFTNVRHRDLFAADPERYAPQFGGFCSVGLTMGKQVAADPEQWTIVDGKLYIKYNKTFRDKWRQDKAAKIQKANMNWSNYLSGGKLEKVGN